MLYFQTKLTNPTMNKNTILFVFIIFDLKKIHYSYKNCFLGIYFGEN